MGMRVFMAGATGVMGRRLVPELVVWRHGDGHHAERGQAAIEHRGADAAVMDGFNPRAVGEVVAKRTGTGLATR
jgi:hypothetical protein